MRPQTRIVRQSITYFLIPYISSRAEIAGTFMISAPAATYIIFDWISYGPHSYDAKYVRVYQAYYKKQYIDNNNYKYCEWQQVI